MGRPKKIEDAAAIKLVDELYAKLGDPKRLKFTELEAYAESVGIKVKAYDLRRNRAVIRRIAEIEALSLNTNALSSIAYKNLDIDGFIKTNKTPAKLKQALSELDERWRKLYDYTISLFEQSQSSAEQLRIADNRIKTFESEQTVISEKLRDTADSAGTLKKENAYLRKMIREYLYPSLADEILQTPDAGDLRINESAVTDMTDSPESIGSFTESVAVDKCLNTREDTLFENLRKRAQE